MKDPAKETIDWFAKRGDSAVRRVTMAFAFSGALMEIGSHALSAMFASGGAFPSGGAFAGLWALWIPLCFITIPPIHYLCRQVTALQKRVDALEAQVAGR